MVQIGAFSYSNPGGAVEYPPYDPVVTEKRSLGSLARSWSSHAPMFEAGLLLHFLGVLMRAGKDPEDTARTIARLEGLGLRWELWVSRLRAFVGKPAAEASVNLLAWLRTDRPGGIPARGGEATEARIQKALPLLLALHSESTKTKAAP